MSADLHSVGDWLYRLFGFRFKLSVRRGVEDGRETGGIDFEFAVGCAYLAAVVALLVWLVAS